MLFSADRVKQELLSKGVIISVHETKDVATSYKGEADLWP